MICSALLVLSALQSLSGDALVRADSLRSQQAVQLDPQALRFTPGHTTATVMFHNPSAVTRQAEVRVEFTYPDWPHDKSVDTIVIAHSGEHWLPHDTVVERPGPTDHFAGRWLTGVPTSVRLAPHETKRVSVTLHPPADLPAGEYWARIVTIVSPVDPRHGGTLDREKRYAVPTVQHAPQIQDTCAVTYRTGTLQMGLAIGPGARAVVDSTNVGDTEMPKFAHALWVRLPVKLTGNVPFRGQMHAYYHNVTTGEDVRPNTKEFSLYKDAVLHWVVQTSTLSPGQYTLTLRFDNEQASVPSARWVSMTPVEVTFRFEVKPAWAY